MQHNRHFYISGQWVEAPGVQEFHVINPATEEASGTIALGSARHVDWAVTAARDAFPSWSVTSVDERAALMERLVEIYQRRAEEMAQAISLEMGAPITFARGLQTETGEGALVATIEALGAHAFERPSPRGGSLLLDEPVGVCGLITPWNWPILQIVVKVAPALAAGCTMVLKPSEYSPYSALLFAEMLDEAGFPPGVFNLVNGTGPEVGAAMSAHHGIDMISFTGSTRAGIAVTKSAADTVKRVTLELGGKSPNLLFADADIEAATRISVEGCFGNSGQSCDAPTRLLVERSVYDDVVDIAAGIAEATQVGPPEQEGDHLGPVVNSSQFLKVQNLIRIGLSEGARCIAGGTDRPNDLNRGYYIRPTVFADVGNDMQIAREEIFGPVLSIIPFETEADAVRMANDTPYGLAAYIQTGNDERALRVARQLRAGSINVNGEAADYDVPFGGYKQSGNGREFGQFGLHDYLEVKAVNR
ncbi:MAG: aldehyde dehydrogenase family protein [Pseudomonadota bacterium]